MALDPTSLEVLACPEVKGPLNYNEAERILALGIEPNWTDSDESGT